MSSTVCAGEPIRFRSFTIFADLECRKTALPELLRMELMSDPIDPDPRIAPLDRVSIGRIRPIDTDLPQTDIWVFLDTVIVKPVKMLRVICVDWRRAARLSESFCPFNERNASSMALGVMISLTETHRRYADGIDRMVAICPLRCLHAPKYKIKTNHSLTHLIGTYLIKETDVVPLETERITRILQQHAQAGTRPDLSRLTALITGEYSIVPLVDPESGLTQDSSLYGEIIHKKHDSKPHKIALDIHVATGPPRSVPFEQEPTPEKLPELAKAIARNVPAPPDDVETRTALHRRLVDLLRNQSQDAEATDQRAATIATAEIAALIGGAPVRSNAEMAQLYARLFEMPKGSYYEHVKMNPKDSFDYFRGYSHLMRRAIGEKSVDPSTAFAWLDLFYEEDSSLQITNHYALSEEVHVAIRNRVMRSLAADLLRLDESAESTKSRADIFAFLVRSIIIDTLDDPERFIKNSFLLRSREVTADLMQQFVHLVTETLDDDLPLPCGSLYLADLTPVLRKARDYKWLDDDRMEMWLTKLRADGGDAGRLVARSLEDFWTGRPRIETIEQNYAAALKWREICPDRYLQEDPLRIYLWKLERTIDHYRTTGEMPEKGDIFPPYSAVRTMPKHPLYRRFYAPDRVPILAHRTYHDGIEPIIEKMRNEDYAIPFYRSRITHEPLVNIFPLQKDSFAPSRYTNRVKRCGEVCDVAFISNSYYLIRPNGRLVTLRNDIPSDTNRTVRIVPNDRAKQLWAVTEMSGIFLTDLDGNIRATFNDEIGFPRLTRAQQTTPQYVDLLPLGPDRAIVAATHGKDYWAWVGILELDDDGQPQVKPLLTPTKKTYTDPKADNFDVNFFPSMMANPKKLDYEALPYLDPFGEARGNRKPIAPTSPSPYQPSTPSIEAPRYRPAPSGSGTTIIYKTDTSTTNPYERPSTTRNPYGGDSAKEIDEDNETIHTVAIGRKMKQNGSDPFGAADFQSAVLIDIDTLKMTTNHSRSIRELFYSSSNSKPKLETTSRSPDGEELSLKYDSGELFNVTRKVNDYAIETISTSIHFTHPVYKKPTHFFYAGRDVWLFREGEAIRVNLDTGDTSDTIKVPTTLGKIVSTNRWGAVIHHSSGLRKIVPDAQAPSKDHVQDIMKRLGVPADRTEATLELLSHCTTKKIYFGYDQPFRNFTVPSGELPYHYYGSSKSGVAGVRIDRDSTVDDEALDRIEAFPNLRYAHLSRDLVDQKLLETLAACDIETLEIVDSTIAPDALPVLRRMTSLRYLSLVGAKIDRATIEALPQLPQVTCIAQIYGEDLTEEDYETFRKKVPAARGMIRWK